MIAKALDVCWTEPLKRVARERPGPDLDPPPDTGSGPELEVRGAESLIARNISAGQIRITMCPRPGCTSSSNLLIAEFSPDVRA